MSGGFRWWEDDDGSWTTNAGGTELVVAPRLDGRWIAEVYETSAAIRLPGEYRTAEQAQAAAEAYVRKEGLL